MSAPCTTGWHAGVRASVPLLLPTVAIGLTFGVLAAPRIGAVPAVMMSVLVWAGTAQFAAISVLGGGAGLAVATGLLANLRYLPMGFAIAPSLRGPAWRRAVSGPLLADASFVLAAAARAASTSEPSKEPPFCSTPDGWAAPRSASRGPP